MGNTVVESTNFQIAVVAILHFFLVSSSFISETELTTQQLDPAHCVWIEIRFVLPFIKHPPH